MNAPQHEVHRLKYAVEGCFNGVWGDEPNGTDDMTVVRVADFDRKTARVALSDNPTVRAIPPSARNRRVLARGDLLIEKSGGGEQQPVGNVVLFDSDVHAVCSNFVARLPVVATCDARFIAYAFQSLYAQARNIPHIKQTSGIQNLDSETYLNEPVWQPPFSKQVRIANFLDEQTARIDALIAEKERLLELLAEQRLSVAERVLAPAPSGQRGKLGFFVDLLPGYAFPADEFSRDPIDIPLLRGVNVAPSAIRWDDVVYWAREHDSALDRFKLEQGDVILGMDRPWISTGARVAMVDESSKGALLLQRVCRLRGSDAMQQRFLYYALSSDEFRQSIEVEMTGVSVPHISPEQVLRFKVPILSPTEQAARCHAADFAVLRIEQLEVHTTGMLGRLREYRSSLISAAVTGQLGINSYKVAA